MFKEVFKKVGDRILKKLDDMNAKEEAKLQETLRTLEQADASLAEAKRELEEATANHDATQIELEEIWLEKERMIRKKMEKLEKARRELREMQGEGGDDRISADHGEAIKMNETFNETKVAEELAKEKARVAEETATISEAEAAQLTAVRAKLSGEGVKTETAPTQEDPE